MGHTLPEETQSLAVFRRANCAGDRFAGPKLRKSDAASGPFCAHLERDAQLLEHYAAAIHVCVHANSRIMTESDRESAQRDDAFHAPTLLYSSLGIRVASKQELIDRIHQYFEDQRCPRCVPLEVQDGLITTGSSRWHQVALKTA
jgi:hypothetical protein